MKKLHNQLEKNHNLFKHWRHTLHQCPELSFEEHKTSQFVIKTLKEIGVDEIHTGIGGTGVVGILKNGPGPSIGLRADMDALPINEAGGHGYRSINPGVMHACGHDGHVAMLLGAAKYLTETREFRGTVVLIFQPGEETIAGAPAMIRDGLLERFPIDSIFTLHSWPGASVHQMFVNEGAVMACVNNFDIHIKSKGGHAAMPHLSSDPILAGSEIILALQKLVSRRVDPQHALVLSCCVFDGGTIRNVIPRHVTIKGTARYIDSQIGEWLPKAMHDIIEGIARGNEVTTDFNFVKQCPPTINSNYEAKLANSVITELLDVTDTSKPVSMGSDDFCFYLEEVPGAYVYLGNGKKSNSLHHPEYDFNDDALLIGIAFYIRLVQKNGINR